VFLSNNFSRRNKMQFWDPRIKDIPDGDDFIDDQDKPDYQGEPLVRSFEIPQRCYMCPETMAVICENCNPPNEGVRIFVVCRCDICGTPNIAN
jgi:hypothetical protein